MREDIQEDWLKYHAENPHVYQMFEKFALQVAERVDCYSAKAIVERLRWHYRFEVEGDWEFKITNTHTTPMARHFIKRNPQLKGFFQFKTQEKKETGLDEDKRETSQEYSGGVSRTDNYNTDENGQHSFI